MVNQLPVDPLFEFRDCLEGLMGVAIWEKAIHWYLLHKGTQRGICGNLKRPEMAYRSNERAIDFWAICWMRFYIIAVVLAIDPFHENVSHVFLTEAVIYLRNANDVAVDVFIRECLSYRFSFGDIFAIFDPDKLVILEPILMWALLIIKRDDMLVFFGTVEENMRDSVDLVDRCNVSLKKIARAK